MPRRSSWVDMGGYTAWSLPSTTTPDSRASAATPPMKVPAMPRMWIFKSGGFLGLAGRTLPETGGGGSGPGHLRGGVRARAVQLGMALALLLVEALLERPGRDPPGPQRLSPHCQV